MNRSIFFVAVVMAIMGTSLQGQAISVAQGQSQKAGNSGKITLSLRNAPLEVALETLEKQAQLGVTYARRALPSVRVNVSLANASVDQAYSEVLRGTGLALIQNTAGQYVLSVRDGATKAQGSISGTIVDSKTGRGVIGANVSLDNNARSVVSGEDGGYRFVGVASGNHTITVRLVGYAKQTRAVAVGEGTDVNVDFKLESSANVLNDVVVTGTIVSTELKAVPNAITVITAKQIEERGITQINQLFRGDVPGLFASNLGSSSLLDSVAMYSRGATLFPNGAQASAAIKTYVDGVELANPAYLSQIDPRSIERIEILSGPQASTIYGSNAINGVMQVFTKRGRTAWPEIKVNLMSGLIQNNFNSATTPIHTYDGQVSGTEGKMSYNVGGSWDYLGAWTPAKQTQRIGGYGGGRFQAGSLFTIDASLRDATTKNVQNASAPQATIERTLNGEYLPLTSASGYRLDKPAIYNLNGRTTGLTIRVVPSGWWSHELVLGNDRLQNESMRTAIGYNDRLDSTLYFRSSLSSRTSERYTTTVNVPVAFIGQAVITVGGDHWRLSSLQLIGKGQTLVGFSSEPEISRNKPQKNTGAFIQSQLNVKETLFFTYGVRAEWNPGYGEDAQPNLTPRYGVAYTRSLGAVTAKLRGSYGRSTRPPDADLRYGIKWLPYFDLFGPIDLQLPNPDLGPEFQRGGEGGLELYLSNIGSFVVTRYNQTVDGLIRSIIPVDSARSIRQDRGGCETLGFVVQPDEYCYTVRSQNINVGSIRNQGWELQGSVNTGPITTRATYSWTKSRVIGVTPRYRTLLSGTAYQPGRSIDFLPEHTWSTQILYASGPNTLAFNVNGIAQAFIANDNIFSYTSGTIRLQRNRWRFGLPSGYRSIGRPYTTADVNASRRLSTKIEGLLQIQNLTNFYQNDYSFSYPVIGRQTRMGVRINFK